MGSRFYGSVKGSARTEATRQGSEKGGLTGHIRGWNAGVRVTMHAEYDEDGFPFDAATVTMTSGSDSRSPDIPLLEVQEDEKWCPRVVWMSDYLLNVAAEMLGVSDATP